MAYFWVLSEPLQTEVTMLGLASLSPSFNKVLTLSVRTSASTHPKQSSLRLIRDSVHYPYIYTAGKTIWKLPMLTMYLLLDESGPPTQAALLGSCLAPRSIKYRHWRGTLGAQRQAVSLPVGAQWVLCSSTVRPNGAKADFQGFCGSYFFEDNLLNNMHPVCLCATSLRVDNPSSLALC